MRKTIRFFAGWLLLALGSCTVEEIAERDFFTVETLTALRQNNDLLGRTRLRGQVDLDPNLVVPEIEDYGFYWSVERQDLEDRLSELEPISLGTYDINCSGCFEVASPSMESGITYYYRAYAESGARRMLGEIKSTSFLVSTRLELLERQNDTLVLRATILNLDDLDAFVQDFGIVIDKDPTKLATGTAAHSISFGDIDKDTTYQVNFGRVDFNTTYYARPYYLTDTEMYGTIAAYQITDGWTLLDSLPTTLFETAAVSWNEKGYLFGGRENLGEDYSDEIYVFDPTTPVDLGSWTIATETIIGVQEAIALVWQNELFYGYGRQESDPFGLFLYPEMIPFIDSFGDVVPDAFDGVGFVQNDKVYFGTGILESGDYTNVFIEMARENGTIVLTEMAPVPVRVNGGTTDTLGRSGAITFEFNCDHYVAGGRGPSFQYADLQRFTPPTSMSPLGAWETMDHELPGGNRDEGIAVSLDNRAFVGFGFRYNTGYLRDFWEYKPDTPEKWVATEPFPGLPREKAFAFSLNEKIYVGGGFRNRLDLTDPNVIRPQPFRDFWQYTPADHD